jgi:putative copper resistance protein D
MTVAALGVGGLWAAAMVGPGGNGPSGSRTVLMCLGALDLCAFAAAAWLARTSTVLGAAVLGGLDLPWLRDLEADQRRAAGVILLVVVPVSVLLAVVVLLRSQRAGGRGR